MRRGLNLRLKVFRHGFYGAVLQVVADAALLDVLRHRGTGDVLAAQGLYSGLQGAELLGLALTVGRIKDLV